MFYEEIAVEDGAKLKFFFDIAEAEKWVGDTTKEV